MRKTVLLLSVSFLSSSAICLAAGPTEPKKSSNPAKSSNPTKSSNPAQSSTPTTSSNPKENLKQRASDAVKDIGDNMNKAGAAIQKSVDTAGKKVNPPGKPDVGQRLQTDAKQALKKIEAGADKAEHAIVTSVKDIGKKGATKNSGGKPSGDSKRTSLDQSMKELGKNAEKAGTAMENGVKKLGSEVKKEANKADQAIKKKVDHK